MDRDHLLASRCQILGDRLIITGTANPTRYKTRSGREAFGLRGKGPRWNTAEPSSKLERRRIRSRLANLHRIAARALHDNHRRICEFVDREFSKAILGNTVTT